MEHLIETDEGGWTRLLINRPGAKNALNTALLADLAAALTRLSGDDSCRAVMIAGADGNFAAGADIGEIEGKTSTEAAADPRKAQWASIRAFPKPLVAAVEGFALGGGLELALMADLMVVGDSARLGLAETNLGIIPGAGGGQRLIARIGPAKAARMVLTGEIIDADTAFAWGLAACRAGDALAEGAALTARLAQRAPLALQAAKAALIQGAEAALALDAERAAFEALLDSQDKAEGIRAFREKRKPIWQGK
ncbi:2,3-dehydroadipyl-CoA hydratase [Xinfangfangia sp. D13-10-4-6]|uniref:enoyl-CoA hydratase-related protein n=1 Tax=Pseudogemmobacter hezensis TaxID=2737662 RepID=UPI001551EB77|nr:enoyl-CoA hydratase-related protein [Pseudogemmobacter hezensis]NPD14838.1 2,3-dehydroadipyl-CoA hydratase [Pseudogemmobacter hezensis]